MPSVKYFIKALLSSAVAVGAFTLSAFAQDTVATLNDVTGDIFIQRGDDLLVVVDNDTILLDGDVVLTTEGSTVSIVGVGTTSCSTPLAGGSAAVISAAAVCAPATSALSATQLASIQATGVIPVVATPLLPVIAGGGAIAAAAASDDGASSP
ncbi:hypothetical protein [Parvularcula sp. IMCC14364]|uniref:hypothetical protein n=1 Tax=Parvularcula sp. IMCC14364 TaxID=3067902 RepID=UPI0027403766|nr:hypothetical protein [Parvularcula sp. IMCC14364]